MHTFLDNFHQCGIYSAWIANHQTDLRREEKFTDQKYLSFSSLQNYDLNLDSSSGCGKNSERANIVHTKGTFFVGANQSAEKCFKRIRQGKGKYRTAGHSENIQEERTPQKCFRCGSEDHLIEKFMNPPKENDKLRNQVRFN